MPKAKKKTARASKKWPLRASPEQYIRRHPEGPHADLARQLVKLSHGSTLASVKKRALELYRDDWTLRAIAAKLDVCVSTIWNWRRGDENFDRVMATAREERKSTVVSHIEDGWIRRARAGTLTPLQEMYITGNYDPANYKNLNRVEIPVIDEIAKAIPQAEEAVRDIARELARLTSATKARKTSTARS